ncbi:MAG TPA: lysozyme inhibitor LprI family protein, partial [Chthoniobacteraceae bacterium]
AAWSPDSARLLLSFNFYAASPEAAPLASFASNWLCYYDTSSGAFELTDRLRAADKGKIDLTLKAQNLPRDRPVLSAEALGKEGPETPAKERFAKADAQLNQVYAQLLQQLAPDAKTQLRQEERSWLNERETFAWIHAGQMWSPFPEASHVEGQALATETRVAELRKRLDPNGAPAAAGATAEAPAGPVNFSGRYEPVKPLPGTTFELNVEQSPAGATISFSAAQNNGGGAAPDGDGQGQVNDAGVLTFTFQDSFTNEGKGTLKAGKSGYTLQMEVTKVADARCLKYYGTMELRKAKK